MDGGGEDGNFLLQRGDRHQHGVVATGVTNDRKVVIGAAVGGYSNFCAGRILVQRAIGDDATICSDDIDGNGTARGLGEFNMNRDGAVLFFAKGNEGGKGSSGCLL